MARVGLVHRAYQVDFGHTLAELTPHEIGQGIQQREAYNFKFRGLVPFFCQGFSINFKFNDRIKLDKKARVQNVSISLIHVQRTHFS